MSGSDENKEIIIAGKTARYRFRSLASTAPLRRRVVASWSAIADNQLKTLQATSGGQGFDGRMTSEISRKLCGYRQQDKDKGMHDAAAFIGLQQTIDLLVASELKCCYCRQDVLVLYEIVRERLQWTLDRLDNTRGHNADNVAIACLECNLRRRRTDTDLFTFTKQLVVGKLA